MEGGKVMNETIEHECRPKLGHLFYTEKCQICDHELEPVYCSACKGETMTGSRAWFNLKRCDHCKGTGIESWTKIYYAKLHN